MIEERDILKEVIKSVRFLEMSLECLSYSISWCGRCLAKKSEKFMVGITIGVMLDSTKYKRRRRHVCDKKYI